MLNHTRFGPNRTQNSIPLTSKFDKRKHLPRLQVIFIAEILCTTCTVVSTTVALLLEEHLLYWLTYIINIHLSKGSCRTTICRTAVWCSCGTSTHPLWQPYYGADDRIRTCNLVITNHLRYRCATSANIRHRSAFFFILSRSHQAIPLAERRGFEPPDHYCGQQISNLPHSTYSATSPYLVGQVGIEPTSSGFSDRCSDLVSYWPIFKTQKKRLLDLNQLHFV